MLLLARLSEASHVDSLPPLGFLLFVPPSLPEFGFTEKHERDDQIFNPKNRYLPDNPLNPT